MKSHARVVVVGGGVVGCSVLFHLTKMGWRDVVLCERKELTSGSSWHAAGGFHALNGDPGVARLQAYTIRLYKEIQELSGQDVGLHFTGGLNIAATPERWAFLRAEWARHRVLGLSTELLGPGEIRAICPLIEASEVLGAIYDPQEGHLDPYGATLAYAKAASLGGAEIYRHTRVLEIKPSGRGTWQVVTSGGTIEAEHVVNAGGLWAREVGHMVGAELPLVPMEHHYLVTEDLPELADRQQEIPLILDLDGEIYLRQERKGVLLGVYEREATPWALSGTPWEYGETELLRPDLDRLTNALSKGFQRFPALSRAGIRRIVNGPFTFSPDGNPLVGPVPGLRNYWAACGVMAGFAQGGGVGLALSQWMTQGEPHGDIFAMDVARFGEFATRAYTVAKAREFYARRFQIAYPNEFWPAGRPAKTSALHGQLTRSRAVFGVSYGLEYPLYFAPPGDVPAEIPGLHRSNAFAAVAAECHAVREHAAIMDISSFAKYEVTGAQAEAALGRMLAGRLPQVGRVRLTPMLAPSGRLMGDLTTMRLTPDRFWIGGSGYLQSWHMRWFTEHLSVPGVQLRNVTDTWGGMGLVGPRARDILAKLTDEDVSNSALPFMSVRRTEIGFAPAIIARLSVTGELGFEIYVPTAYMTGLQTAIEALSGQHTIRNAGYYALNSLRLEKSFGIWSREFSRDYTPRMTGLDRFIDYERPGFIGRDAALRDRETAPPRRLVSLQVEASRADATGYEPIQADGRMVGFTTSGGFGHFCGASLAMGYLETSTPDTQPGLTVFIAGEERPCRILRQPVIDPSGTRMRA